MARLRPTRTSQATVHTTISNTVRTLLRVNNRSQRELAQAIGIGEDAVSRSMQGPYAPRPRPWPIHEVINIATFFEVPVTSLLGEEEQDELLDAVRHGIENLLDP